MTPLPAKKPTDTAALLDEIIAALPDEPLNPQREVFEEERRRHRREARHRAEKLE